jgi:hypothetical protein
MAADPPVFSIGDRVRWSSSSRGVARSREGVVVAVVPPGTPPFRLQPADVASPLGAFRWRFLDSAVRPGVSYLVALVDGRGRRGQLFHPRVRHLAPLEGSAPPALPVVTVFPGPEPTPEQTAALVSAVRSLARREVLPGAAELARLDALVAAARASVAAFDAAEDVPPPPVLSPRARRVLLVLLAVATAAAIVGLWPV